MVCKIHELVDQIRLAQICGQRTQLLVRAQVAAVTGARTATRSAGTACTAGGRGLPERARLKDLGECRNVGGLEGQGRMSRRGGKQAGKTPE